MKINATKNYVTFSHFQFLLIMVKTLVERDALESYLEIGNAMGLLKAWPYFLGLSLQTLEKGLDFLASNNEKVERRKVGFSRIFCELKAFESKESFYLIFKSTK